MKTILSKGDNGKEVKSRDNISKDHTFVEIDMASANALIAEALSKFKNSEVNAFDESKLYANPKGIIKSSLSQAEATDPVKFGAYKRLCITHKKEYIKSLKGVECMCLACKSQFQNWNSLQRHLQYHVDFKPFLCKICDRSFYSQNKLKRHVDIHKKIKPYTCPICDKRLGRTEHLRRHLLVHSDDKTFGCSICPHTTKRLDGIRRHIKRKHSSEQAISSIPLSPVKDCKDEFLTSNCNSLSKKPGDIVCCIESLSVVSEKIENKLKRDIEESKGSLKLTNSEITKANNSDEDSNISKKNDFYPSKNKTTTPPGTYPQHSLYKKTPPTFKEHNVTPQQLNYLNSNDRIDFGGRASHVNSKQSNSMQEELNSYMKSTCTVNPSFQYNGGFPSNLKHQNNHFLSQFPSKNLFPDQSNPYNSFDLPLCPELSPSKNTLSHFVPKSTMLSFLNSFNVLNPSRGLKNPSRLTQHTPSNLLHNHETHQFIEQQNLYSPFWNFVPTSAYSNY